MRGRAGGGGSEGSGGVRGSSEGVGTGVVRSCKGDWCEEGGARKGPSARVENTKWESNWERMFRRAF